MLKFYITSTTITLFVVLITLLSVYKELKRDGYKIKTLSSYPERIRAWLPFLIPFFNIILALIMIFGYEEIVTKLKIKFPKEGQAHESL